MDSAEVVEGSEDLLTKILLGIPAKPLFKFKIISKRWNSLISARQFSTKWKPTVSGLIAACPNHSGLALMIIYNYIPLGTGNVHWQNLKDPSESIHYIGEVSWLNLRAHLESIYHYTGYWRTAIDILDSLGGLFLCRFIIFLRRVSDLYIYNPTTNRLTSLPDPGPTTEFLSPESMILAYDLSRSTHYKVVLVTQMQVKTLGRVYYSIKVRIYSSETKCWTPWLPNFEILFSIEIDYGAFLNSVVYWPSNESETSSLYYDVDGESFHSFLMPPLANGRRNRNIKHFGVAKGCLVMIVPTAHHFHGYDILELEKDYSGWSIKHCIDLDVIATTVGTPRLHLMCAFGMEDEEDSFLVLYTSDMVISYKPKDGTFKKVCDIKEFLSEVWSNKRYQRSGTKDYYQFVENPFASP